MDGLLRRARRQRALEFITPAALHEHRPFPLRGRRRDRIKRRTNLDLPREIAQLEDASANFVGVRADHEQPIDMTPERRSFSTGTKWEPIVGYSRAVRVGDQVFVTGTTATDELGEIVGVGDAYAQTMQALRNIERALKALDARLVDVVRTRMFVTDIRQWEEYGRAHGQIFGEIRPCTTMVEVSALIDPRMLIEIEADAVVTTAGT